MSEYFINLKKQYPDVAVRYSEKLRCIGGIDPFSVPQSKLLRTTSSVPPITSMDITVYLVMTNSYYTNEQLKAYKSLNAYKTFEAGHVGHLGVIQHKDLKTLIAKVKHSQRTSFPPLNAWVTCQEDGSIINGHCTCMAGAGEVCSHVAAVLFAAEYVNTLRNASSCTEVKAEWLVPKTKEVAFSRVGDMKWSWNKKKETSSVPSITAEEIVNVVRDINMSGAQCVCAKLLEPFVSSSVLAGDQPELKNIFHNLWKREFEDLSHSELLVICEKLVIVITKEDCDAIQTKTKLQSFCKEWHEQRIGRITASIFKAVCRTHVSKPSLTIIKQICYPVNVITRDMQWGIKNERKALMKLTSELSKTHASVTIERIGLCMNPKHPSFAASPDGVINCVCCGLSCAEVKCPSTLKAISLEEFAKKKGSCLKMNDDGSLSLDRNHQYYYQIQMQMSIIEATTCYFGIWAPNKFFIERVQFNNEFWELNSSRALNFHKKVVMPELLAKYFTRQGV